MLVAVAQAVELLMREILHSEFLFTFSLIRIGDAVRGSASQCIYN